MSGKTNGKTKILNSFHKGSVKKPTKFSPRKSNVNRPSKSSGPSYSVKKRVSTYSWNEETIQLLIQNVSQYPVLFDITRADYKDVSVHACANDSIAKGLPNNCCMYYNSYLYFRIPSIFHFLKNVVLAAGSDVKSKWDYLRKLWLHERRELNKEDPSGTGSKLTNQKPL
ncbi:putative Copia protein (Gag-int-pol protein) [Daphnia magna]|uniref:Putative Copia protein (Gag-int-pol protein) n=1 Tax=Daphnia magna TaxID=35525 RepID=A0A162D3E3_9CRUS|nr:putative Copia protein (Gag-int-pol protein) [Daphnia magna]